MTRHRHLRLLGCVFAAVMLLAGCGGGGSAPAAPGPTAGTGGGGGNGMAVEDTLRAYELGSGDRVRITVFRHPDLSGEFDLDGQGRFALPLVGEVSAANRTVRELEREIAAAYSEGFLVDPQVSVEVMNYRPFYILGEVRNPGSYAYVNGMTVLNAVALAGGYTYRARIGGVTIARGGANDATLSAAGDTPILPGDIIEVPERFF